MIAFSRTSLLEATALLTGAALACAGCQGREKPDDTKPVVVSVEAHPAVAVPGQAVTLIWRFALADGWHLYWPGRNDTGYPPQIDLELPAGWLAGGLQWPVPERYVTAGDILDHVYHEELVLIQRVGIGSEAVAGDQAVLRAKLEWLACKDACVPGGDETVLEIPVAAKTESRRHERLDRLRAALPEVLPSGLLQTGWTGQTFTIQAADARRLTFFPTDDCGLLADLLRDGQGPGLALEFRPKGDTVGPVRGLLTVESGSGKTRTFRIDYPAAPLGTASTGG